MKVSIGVIVYEFGPAAVQVAVGAMAVSTFLPCKPT